MKTELPWMFKHMIFNNVSTFTSLLSGLKVSENKTQQKYCSNTKGRIIFSMCGGDVIFLQR